MSRRATVRARGSACTPSPGAIFHRQGQRGFREVIGAVEKYLWISLGAVLGANARYLVGGWAAERWGASFPFGTLIVNLTGSLALGIFLTYATERVLVEPRFRQLIAIGFLGAYTTFSAYTFESVTLMIGGNWGAGLLNLLGGSFAGAIAVGLGIVVGRAL